MTTGIEDFPLSYFPMENMVRLTENCLGDFTCGKIIGILIEEQNGTLLSVTLSQVYDQ